MTTPLAVPPLDPVPFILDADGRSLLDRVARLLVRLLEPSLVARAWDEGYTTEEHQLGWELLGEVGGRSTTVELSVASAALTTADAAVSKANHARLRQLDRAENVWFPRTRAIIRRVVPKERAAVFEAAFFDDLVQKPLGPSVVGSVANFISRVKSLDPTPDSDGAKVRAMLSARGLTDERIAAIEALMAEMNALGAPTTRVSAPTVAEVAASNARRAAALEALTRWYDDWATTFRSVFTVREQIKLALTAPKTKKAKRKKAKTATDDVPRDPSTSRDQPA